MDTQNPNRMPQQTPTPPPFQTPGNNQPPRPPQPPQQPGAFPPPVRKQNNSTILIIVGAVALVVIVAAVIAFFSFRGSIGNPLSGLFDKLFGKEEPVEIVEPVRVYPDFAGEWSGSIGGKYKVHMHLTEGKQKHGQTEMGGYYFYGREPKNGTLALQGSIREDGDFYLIETNDKGEVTGRFKGQLYHDSMMSGTFVNYRNQTFTFTLSKD